MCGLRMSHRFKIPCDSRGDRLARGCRTLCQLHLLIGTFLFAGAHVCMAQSPMVPWLTRSGDNSRSGWNPHETQLTQASVVVKGIKRATLIPVFGDARGMEAQPLILPHFNTDLGTSD